MIYTRGICAKSYETQHATGNLNMTDIIGRTLVNVFSRPVTITSTEAYVEPNSLFISHWYLADSVMFCNISINSLVLKSTTVLSRMRLSCFQFNFECLNIPDGMQRKLTFPNGGTYKTSSDGWMRTDGLKPAKEQLRVPLCKFFILPITLWCIHSECIRKFAWFIFVECS